MDRFERILQETEARYQSRTPRRERAVELLHAGRVLDADTEDRVLRRLERLEVDPVATRLALEGAGLAPLPRPGGPAAADPMTLERIMGQNDLMSVSFLEMGLRVSRCVAKVHVKNAAGQTVSYGTGFMVSPRLFLTNNHVLETASYAGNSHVEFDYQIGLDGNPLPSLFCGLRPDLLFLTDPDLDFTLVAVQDTLLDDSPFPSVGWCRLIAQEGKILTGEYLNIIQHPNGEPKQLALRENQLVDVLDDFLHYKTDTAPGSSGSPVFSDQWEVVALHHSGVPERDAQGNILTRDGQRWRRWMGEHRISWEANEGARISRVVKEIQGSPMQGDAAQLRSELFEAEPVYDEPVGPASLCEGEATRTALADISQSRGADGSVTWTIPLNVTVQLGQLAQSASSGGSQEPTPAHRPGAPALPGTGAPVHVPGGPPSLPDDDEDLVQALDELRDAENRPYYDACIDQADADQYYKGLRIREGAPSYRALSQLVRDTHAEVVSYKPAVYCYPWVDLHPDLKIHSIYTGEVYEPEDMIREDLAVAYEVSRRMAEMVASEGVMSVERMEEELALLEASLPYNCEHVVCQSWFGKRQPMRGDLHHLFACESRCNSFRNRHAYYDFPDFEEGFMSGCGKSASNKFEPFQGKGPAARATLYFLLRYPGLIDKDMRELELERLDTLLAWHEANPVDAHERHRNMAIFAIQGNRNPLIDHPEWAAGISFAQGLA